MAQDKQDRIALLIDCDNASYQFIQGVLEELAKYGAINIRHAYGDWNSPYLKGWREDDVLYSNAIVPMQQFAYTKNKNATDVAMIIDAMDILYAGNVDAFALMSSDSDFTPLVVRLRENGLLVYGFGEEKTPEPFVKACTRFIYTEDLQHGMEEEESSQQDNSSGVAQSQTRQPAQRVEGRTLRQDTLLVGSLRLAVEQTSGDDDDGWSHLGQVGKYILNLDSSFSYRKYGFAKLGDLIREIDLFDIKTKNNSAYIKDKRIHKSAKKKVSKKKVGKKS